LQTHHEGVHLLSSEWQVISELRYQTVAEGMLATSDTAGLPSGTYRLRLVVVDQTGNFVPPYEVRVSVNP
jgi:hypothetical protein